MRIIIFVILALSLAACAPYQPDVPQGNQYKQAMVKKLNIGMTPQQVESIMGGAPVYQNTYDDNTMNYVYTFWNYKTGSEKPKKIILTFKNALLVKIQNN